MGLAVAPASTAIVGTLSPDKVGAGSGLRSMVQLLGGAFGVAIVGSLATTAYRSNIHAALAGALRSVPAGAEARHRQSDRGRGRRGRLPCPMVLAKPPGKPPIRPS